MNNSPLAHYGSQAQPIDLTNDEDDIFPEPAKHWSKLFQQQLSGERENVDNANGASSTAMLNYHGNAILDNTIKQKFRINARSVFLTYPQCPLSKEELLTFLCTLKYEAQYVIVCMEKHKDGTPHLHALINFQKKIDLQNQRFFDINGYHPNIQTTKNINASITYIKKCGDYIEEGSRVPHVNSLASPKLRELPEYNEVWDILRDLLIGYE